MRSVITPAGVGEKLTEARRIDKVLQILTSTFEVIEISHRSIHRVRDRDSCEESGQGGRSPKGGLFHMREVGVCLATVARVARIE